MKRNRKLLSIMFVLLLMPGLISCMGKRVPVTISDAQHIVDRARDYFKVARKKALEKHEFERKMDLAEKKLRYAEKALETQTIEDAYKYATQSYNLSQEVLTKIFVGEKDQIEIAKKQFEKIKEIQKTEPVHPMTEYLPRYLALFKAFDQALKGKPVEDLHLRVMDVTILGPIMEETIATQIDQELSSEISFNRGTYTLKNRARRDLSDFVENAIITGWKEQSEKHPNEKIKVVVTVQGFTDSTGFRYDSGIVEDLVKGVESELPSEKTKRRMFLNKRLSLFRATEITKYLKKIVGQEEPAILETLRIVPRGLGETFPTMNDPSDPFRKRDRRRLICKINVQFMKMEFDEEQFSDSIWIKR